MLGINEFVQKFVRGMGDRSGSVPTALLRHSGKKKSLNSGAGGGQPPVQANNRRDINYEEIRDQSNYARCDRVHRRQKVCFTAVYDVDNMTSGRRKQTRIRRIKVAFG